MGAIVIEGVTVPVNDGVIEPVGVVHPAVFVPGTVWVVPQLLFCTTFVPTQPVFASGSQVVTVQAGHLDVSCVQVPPAEGQQKAFPPQA